jgi:lipoprotein NlpD
MNLTIANLRIAFNPLCAAALLGVLLAGCRTPSPAPVIDRTVPLAPAATALPGSAETSARRPGDSRPEFHDVRRGETLYSIALEYGLPYKDLAQWNGLDNPAILSTGQRLRLTPPDAGATLGTGDAGVVVTPLGQADAGTSSSETRSRWCLAAPFPAKEPPSAERCRAQDRAESGEAPYSEKALAQLQNARSTAI